MATAWQPQLIKIASGTRDRERDVRLVISILRTVAPSRLLAEQICERTGEEGWDHRRVRAAAEASRGRILSAPGCPGYRLAESTSVTDFYSTERQRYRSQIIKMFARLRDMDRAIHGKGKI